LTHAVGVFPAEEALKHRPQLVQRVVVHADTPARERARIEALAGDRGLVVAVDSRHVEAHRRHAAAWVLVELHTEEDTLSASDDHLVLFRAAQAGNVGSALRAALGFGVLDVALVDARVDAWSPHLLRASQGARFALRVRAFADWSSYQQAHPNHHTLAFVPPQANAPTTALPALVRPTEQACAWVFGPEGGGLPDAVTLGGTRVSIPQHPHLESHNLAVAVGVALYARGSMRSHA